MSDVQRGFTFTDGGTGTAEDLHQLVDDATILPDFILGKSASTPDELSNFIYADSRTGQFLRITFKDLVASFPGGATGLADPGVAALRTLGILGTQAAPGNDVRFPSTITGLRLGNGVARDTAARPKDLSFLSVNLNGGQEINWDAADLFYDNLTINPVYTFTGGTVRDGRVITVALKLNAHTITWPALFGAVPGINASATVHYFTFIKSGLNPNPSAFVTAI